MPKAIKKKVTKKAGLKEEEVKSVAVRALDLIRGRKNIVIPVLLVLCIIAVSYVAFVLNLYSEKEEAYSIETEAYTYYYNVDLKTPLTEEERWKKSLELFQSAVKVRPTAAVLFYAGNCYFNLGDYDNAIKTYNQFIDRYKTNEVILPLVYQKLASVYIKKGENDKALKILGSLASFKGGVFKDTALILEARYHDSAGRREDAMKRYRELAEEFPSSPFAEEAASKIKAEESGQDKKEEGKDGGQQTETEQITPEDQSQAQPQSSGY